MFERVQAGQVAAIHYPLRAASRAYSIGGAEYQGHWRGNTMLTIEPGGERYPIYRRGTLAEQPDPARGVPSRS